MRTGRMVGSVLTNMSPTGHTNDATDTSSVASLCVYQLQISLTHFKPLNPYSHGEAAYDRLRSP